MREWYNCARILSPLYFQFTQFFCSDCASLFYTLMLCVQYVCVSGRLLGCANGIIETGEIRGIINVCNCITMPYLREMEILLIIKILSHPHLF